MWSASSSTVISIASRWAKPCFMRSSRRPGQATTMSTPRLSAATCGFWPTPPKIVVTVRPYASASGAITAVICVASSRVGREHEAERATRAALATGELAGEARDHGQRERERLAGAGLAAAEHVAAGEGVGQGVLLDGEGLRLALCVRAQRRGERARRARRRMIQSLGGVAFSTRAAWIPCKAWPSGSALGGEGGKSAASVRRKEIVKQSGGIGRCVLRRREAVVASQVVQP